LIFVFHDRDTLSLSILLFLHILPPLEVPLILLNPTHPSNHLKNLPPGINDFLFFPDGFFSIFFFNCCEISVESVVLGQEVTALWVRRVDQGVVHILVVLANPVTESGLLDLVSVADHILIFDKIMRN
jgi:hypothetical protein